MKTLCPAIIVILFAAMLGSSLGSMKTPQEAYATDCGIKETSLTIPQFYRLSDAVFVGTVSSIQSYANHQWMVKFNVEKIWKGTQSTKITIITGSVQACGYSLVEGEKYLIFASGSPLDYISWFSKPYADAQANITIFDDPQFQAQEKSKEELSKRLEVAKEAISNMMVSRMGDIPFNAVGVDEINSTLDVGIDSTKATLSEEEYLKKIKEIVGDIPIKITFGQNIADTGNPDNNVSGKNSLSSLLPPPLKQFKSGIPISNIQCAQDLSLVIKAEDKTPACIKQESISKLILRGWISTTSSLDQNNIISGEFYQGIENDSGIVSIKHQTYYMMTATNTTYPVASGMTVKFHQITFSFPYGSQATPGGVIIPFDMTFPEGITETYGNVTKNPDGSGSISGIGLGPGPSSNRTVTVQSVHMHPQAGVTMTEDQIKLLVSTDVDATNIQTQTSDSSSALKLYLSTSSQVIQPGQPIGITISVNNTLSSQVMVQDENSWKLNNLSVNPCTTAPYGIAIFDGFYSEKNMTDGKPLVIFSLDALCPAYNKTTQTYVFQPSSGHVTLNNCQDTQSTCSSGYDMGSQFSFSGTWENGQIKTFTPGIYTIVGGDEWGHIAIEHFVVTNSTIFAGDLGTIHCPARYGGVQFGATIKNSTGFANYYNSTQYRYTFFSHPGMKGTITVQYNSPANAAWFQNNGNAPFNMTNGAALFYMANVTKNKNMISYAASLYNDETGHHSRICHYGIGYGGGFEEPCNADNTGNIPLGELPHASRLLHVGIDTSFEPNSVMLYPNTSPVFTATVSASPDAVPGAYWLSLQWSLCGPGVLAKLVVLP